MFKKKVSFVIFSISISYVILYINKIDINRKKSLILLKEKALNADFKVLIFVTQKFIKKKEVNPINSHPKNNINVFPEDTKKSILKMKRHKNNKNLSTKGSYLK